MKQFFFFCTAVCFCASAAAQTLFTYGNKTVSKEEFTRAYYKNKPAKDDEQTRRDYLKLYSNFKLKVQAAEEMHLDTLPQIRYDVQSFREQVAENFMGDEKAMESMTREAAVRGLKEIHVLVFQIPATEVDSSKAAATANEVYRRLQAGSTEYVNDATDISAKFSKVNYSDGGYISVFALPYDYENIIFNLPANGSSKPFRGDKSYFIFKNIGERAAAGKWRVAHILFAYPPDADYNTKLAVKQKADSVYGLLKNGLDFGSAAKAYSDDRITYLNNGELPEFSTGRYDLAFENNAYKLKTDDEIGKPFESRFGYHVIKRLSQTPVAVSATDQNHVYEIRQRLLQDARIIAQKEQFSRSIMGMSGYKKAAGLTDAELFRYADSVMKTPSIEKTNEFPLSKKTVLSFKDGSAAKGDEWLKYVREYRLNPAESKTLTNAQLWQKFAGHAALKYYRVHLEEYNPDFKFQMQEFKEGNMLFEVMEKKVWGLAGSDTAALKAYYNEHQGQYKWQESADVLIFNAAEKEALTAVLVDVSAGRSFTEILQKADSKFQADSGRYELTQIPDSTRNGINPHTTAIMKNADGSYWFARYINFYPAGMQRSFNESRGLVINDYQTVLEEKWLNELRVKHPVKVNETVFNSIAPR